MKILFVLTTKLEKDKNYPTHQGLNEFSTIYLLFYLFIHDEGSESRMRNTCNGHKHSSFLTATNNGFQPTAVKRMIDRITG